MDLIETMQYFKSIGQTNVDRGLLLVHLLLDAICQNDESNENSDGAIQKPDVTMVLENFSTDQNGKSHNSTDNGVKPWKTQAWGKWHACSCIVL